MYEAVGKHWRAAAWMLQRTRPEDFGRHRATSRGEREEEADDGQEYQQHDCQPLVANNWNSTFKREDVRLMFHRLLMHTWDKIPRSRAPRLRRADRRRDYHIRRPARPTFLGKTGTASGPSAKPTSSSKTAAATPAEPSTTAAAHSSSRCMKWTMSQWWLARRRPMSRQVSCLRDCSMQRSRCHCRFGSGMWSVACTLAA